MLVATKQREVPVPIIPKPNELDEMFREHHTMVFRTAYRIAGNAADAEDVLQTVFLRMARREDSANVIERPENYLRRAAVHAALDVVRARREAVTVDLERLPSNSGARPDDGDLRTALRRALSELPARSAEIFALRFFEGLTNPEIGKALGMSSIRVAVSLHRTRKILQQKLRA